MEIRLLVISHSAWNDNNGIGNTLSNLFGGWKRDCIANLYCRSELPANNVCSKYYNISDAQLIKSIFSISTTAGNAFSINSSSETVLSGGINQGVAQTSERRLYNVFRIYRSNFFLLVHELIWFFGRWKNPKLNAYLEDFAPNIIFMPVYQSRYAHRLLWYIQKQTSAKIVLFHADDYVTTHQKSFSPFFWINRLSGRRAIIKSVKLSSINYSSQHNVDELMGILKVPLKPLYKCGYFTGNAPVTCQVGDPIRLIYTGNISGGRWKTLAKIGEVLRIINSGRVKAKLEIYTQNPLTDTMKSKLDDGINIFFKGSLEGSQVKSVQESADILVHVESFEKKYLLEARLSFSTKIVDYLQRARCILAVGSRDCASIDYIETNDAGMVVADEKELPEKLKLLIDTPSLILDFGHKAYACGAKNHQSEKIKTMLKSDFDAILRANSEGTVNTF
jgi:glycosyltransferase involved in cell wall biosynthesis